MNPQTGKETAAVVVVSAQSERPFAAALQLLSDNTLRLVGAQPITVGPGWQNFLNVTIDAFVPDAATRFATIHADGRRFRTTAAAANAILRAARAHRNTDPRVQVNHHSTPNWFWWHDGTTSWALTRTPTGHQIWWTASGKWRQFAHLDFPWHPTAAVGPYPRGLVIWRDEPYVGASHWSFIRTSHPDIVRPALTAWLEGQSPTTPKETTMPDQPAHTLLIETTQGDLTQVTISIDDHLSQRITRNTRAWVQGSIDGRALFVQADVASTRTFDYPINTDRAAQLLKEIITVISQGQMGPARLETLIRRLAREGWDATHRDTAFTDSDADVELPEPKYPHWTPGVDIDGHDRCTIDADTLRDLVDQAAQYQRVIHGKVLFLDGRSYRLVDIPALRESLHNAIRPAVDKARDELGDKAR